LADNFVDKYRFRRSMDRTFLCGRKNLGSIPNGSTLNKSNRKNRLILVNEAVFSYESFLIAFANRDFFREAVFFLITPFLAALSSAL